MKSFLIALLLICIIAVGGAFYLGWLNVSTADSYDNRRREVTLTIDKEKVKEDIDAVKQKAGEVGEKIGQTSKDVLTLGKTVNGQLQEVDAAKKEVTVKSSDGKETVTVKVDEQTKIKVGDKDGASLSELKSGDPVTLVYVPKDGVDVAVSVWVKPAKS